MDAFSFVRVKPPQTFDVFISSGFSLEQSLCVFEFKHQYVARLHEEFIHPGRLAGNLSAEPAKPKVIRPTMLPRYESEHFAANVLMLRKTDPATEASQRVVQHIRFHETIKGKSSSLSASISVWHLISSNGGFCIVAAALGSGCWTQNAR